MIRRDKGNTLSLLVQFLLKPWVPCAPPPCFLAVLFSRLSGLAATEPTLSYLRFFNSFHPSLPRSPRGVYNSCAVSCASAPLFRPPRSHPRPRSHLRHCSRFRPYMCVYVCTCLTFDDADEDEASPDDLWLLGPNLPEQLHLVRARRHPRKGAHLVAPEDAHHREHGESAVLELGLAHPVQVRARKPGDAREPQGVEADVAGHGAVELRRGTP